MKKIFVTGGEGYIGKEICRAISKTRMYYLAVDCKTQFNVIERSLRLVEDFNTVIHLASFVSNPESIKNPLDYYYNNILSTLEMLKAMKKGDRFIFSSTAAVYGTPWNHYDPTPEQAELKPATPYAKSKVMCEQIIQDVCEARGIEYIIFRYFNVAGGNNPNRHALIPAVIDALKNNKQFEIYGNDWTTPDGTAIRDFISVKDVARAHVTAINSLETNYILNIGSGKGYSVREVIKAAEKIAKKRLKVVIKPRRTGDISAVYADISLAKEAIGFVPQMTLEQMIKTEWEAFK